MSRLRTTAEVLAEAFTSEPLLAGVVDVLSTAAQAAGNQRTLAAATATWNATNDAHDARLASGEAKPVGAPYPTEGTWGVMTSDHWKHLFASKADALDWIARVGR